MWAGKASIFTLATLSGTIMGTSKLLILSCRGAWQRTASTVSRESSIDLLDVAKLRALVSPTPFTCCCVIPWPRQLWLDTASNSSPMLIPTPRMRPAIVSPTGFSSWLFPLSSLGGTLHLCHAIIRAIPGLVLGIYMFLLLAALNSAYHVS